MPPTLRRDGPSDKTIVRRARQGDRQAFLTLLRRYDPRLRRLALRLLADPKRIDRVLTRAYLKAWRSLPFLARGEAVPSWLYRIVYNACINEMRWEPSRPVPPPPDGPSVPLPAATIVRRLLALRALRAAERIPLVLIDGEGFSLDAASRIMRRPPEEVAAGLARARGRWRSFVTGEPEPADPDPVSIDDIDDDADRGLDPTALVSPAETLAALATLAAPSAPREPGGHVRLLSHGAGTMPTAPLVAAKPPPISFRYPEPAPPADADEDDAEQEAVPSPTGEAGSSDDQALDARRGEAEAGRTGAGARRKRRRDAKRAAVRTPIRGTQASGAAGPGTARRSAGAPRSGDGDKP